MAARWNAHSNDTTATAAKGGHFYRALTDEQEEHSRFGTLSSDQVSRPAGARLPLTLLGRS
jgi:hypothetical protein